MENSQSPGFPWAKVLSELIGTALFIGCGLSIVIFIHGDGSPMARLLPGVSLRLGVTGFLFGSIGALIALSPVGKISGAHINPVVTIGFRLMGKLDLRTTLGYVAAQCAGAVLGSLPLLLWGEMGKSVMYGATLPGRGVSLFVAFSGEAAATFAMVALLIVFLAVRRLRPFTPALFPPLYALLVPLEASLSGTSTNPARTFGPAVISGQWQGGWIYWAGPLLGMLAATLVCSALARRITEAKLYYFDSPHDRLFRRPVPQK